MVLVTKDRYEV
ncbi:hypothetical protein A2U01_0079538, partial [Trifolium medium]|nr:hypothetical protein [Trifolium medium]